MRPAKPDTVIAAFRVALARAIPGQHEPRNVAPGEGDLRVPRKFLCWERRAARVTHDFRRDKMDLIFVHRPDGYLAAIVTTMFFTHLGCSDLRKEVPE